MRTRENLIWINHESKEALRVVKINLKNLNPIPPYQKSPTEKELGCLVVKKILSSFWGSQRSSVLLAGGEGKARDLGQEGNPWKEPRLHTLGSPKPH